MSQRQAEKPGSADLVVTLTSVGILFCFLYSSFVFTVSAVGAFETGSDSTDGVDVSTDLESDIESAPLEEFTKPDKKKAGQENDVLPKVPERIIAPSINLDADIVSPHSRDIDVLDNALLKGVVHYPGSGYAGESSNILLFGHSSFLPVVHNQNFKIFNYVKELEVGDSIVLESNGEEFTYSVTSNIMAKDHEVRVNLKSDRPMLTLVTCNSFGAKEDRYIIEAVLVE